VNRWFVISIREELNGLADIDKLFISAFPCDPSQWNTTHNAILYMLDPFPFIALA